MRYRYALVTNVQLDYNEYDFYERYLKLVLF